MARVMLGVPNWWVTIPLVAQHSHLLHVDQLIDNDTSIYDPVWDPSITRMYIENFLTLTNGKDETPAIYFLTD